MTTKTRPAVKLPTKMDVKKADALVSRLIRENKQWLKEMADK